jgi:hypothetical protein
MTTPSTTDGLIEDLLDATYGKDAHIRQKFAFKQALLGLVRLAKAEQVFEMRTTVDKLIGVNSSVEARQRTKSRQRSQAQAGRWPQQMQFSQFD